MYISQAYVEIAIMSKAETQGATTHSMLQKMPNSTDVEVILRPKKHKD